MLTDGSAHDCPAAKPLIERRKPAKKLLGDKAYDSAELRHWLKQRGTKSVIPNRSNRNSHSASAGSRIAKDIASRTRSVG
jgi:IS5 family transposase